MTNKDDDDQRESTRAGMPLPPGAKKTDAPAKPAHEETHIGGAMPVLPGAKRPAAAPPKTAEAAAPPVEGVKAHDDAKPISADDDLEETVFEVRSPFSLMHVKPPGHGMPITLSGTSYILGRSRSCDVQLFSSTAHRQHAKLFSRSGTWVLQPVENHIVIANGDLVRGEVPLLHKMRLQFGDDEFVFFDERKAAIQTRTEKSIPPLRRSALPRWALLTLIGAAVLLAAGVLLWWGM